MTRAQRPADWELWRLQILLAVMLGGFGLIIAALWHTQVATGESYRRDLMRQSVRRVRIPAMRGRIFDRHGAILAENRPSYAIALYLEELRPRRGRRGETTLQRVHETIEEIQARIGLPPQIADDDIRRHIRRRLPLPLVAWRDIPEAAVARWAERAAQLPGVDLYVEPVRIYPERKTLCHVLGYVGTLREEPKPEDPDEIYHYRLPEFEGLSGLESKYETLLRGEAGGRLVPVDVAGFRRRDIELPSDRPPDRDAGAEDPLRHTIREERCEPRAGRDVKLTIDLKIQRLAETALGDSSGAVVVLDPRNGDVLAMASTPGYDPNVFVPSITISAWNELLTDPARPLLNRATVAAYSPGSTFKPLVALAALGRGWPPARSISCPGVFMVGRQPFRCWDTLGHGALDLRGALRHSCNVYFFNLGIDVGADVLAAGARTAGLGAPAGIDYTPEAAGLVPDPAWKRASGRESWSAGDTANYSIGQGFLTATPLQMARATAALANGGLFYRPRLLAGSRPLGDGPFEESPPVVERKADWKPEHLRVVRDGMTDVVMAEDGTGKRLRVPGVVIAAKTGTAEYGPRDRRRKRGWMIAYAPAEAPRYAAAMMLEDAVSGGLTVAPRLQVLFNGIFHPEAASAEAGGPP